MNDFDPGPWRALRPEERSDTAPGYMEFARQNFEDAQRVSNFDAHWANYYDAFNSVNDRIKTATGTALENPVSSSQGPGAAAEALVAFSREGVQQMTPVQAWTRSVNELRAKHADALPWDDLIDEPHRVAWAKMKEVRERTDLMTEQAGLLQGKDVPLVGSIPKAGPAIGTFVAFPYNLVTSPGYTASQLAGSLAGQMTSPVDASVNLLSFGAGGAAKSLLKNMVLNASVNAVGQAALSAPKQISYKSAGLPYGVEVWLNEVAGAAATGGALDLSIRGPSRAILTRYGRDTPAGTMFSRNTERGGFLLDAIEAPKLPEAPVRPVIEPELIKKAEAGDIAATRTIAERTGAINDPAIKGGLDFMEMGGKVSDETLARMEEMGLARWDGMRMLAQAIHGRVPEVPGVVAKADHPLMPAEAHRILTEGADRFEEMMRDASPKLDAIDPRLASYVTDAVDAGLGRVVPLVQKALDNGGPDALVREISRLADEVGADRLAAETTIHASKNPLAVAAAIRRHPDLVTTALDLGATPVKIGRAIAGMDDIAHQAVMRGAVHPEVAAMVAERVPRQHQAKVVSDLETAHPRSLTEAAELIDALTPEMKHSGAPLDGGIKIDDPAGPEAKRQVEALKQEAGRPFEEAMRPIAERQQLDKQVMDLKGKIAEAERKPADEATALEIGKLRAGLHEAETRLAAVKVELDQSEGAAAVHRMVMREIDIKRANDALRALRDAAALAERILPDGTKIEFKDDLRYQGLELDGITTEAGDVAIFRHAMNPAAILGHETVHALRRRGLISESEIKTLAKLAREEGVFQKEARYREEYKDRANFESLIDEEAAAAYIEARIKGDAKGPENTTAARIQQFFERLRNLLSGYGFKSEQDVVNALLSGEMAKRQGSVQDWMRQEDVTAFAMREGDDHVANAWDELARQDYSYERARWHEVTRPTKPQAPDMARRENDAIMKKAASAERDMIRQGLSPREIAAAMNKLHGTSLTAEDIAARNVWWNVDNKLPPAFDKAPEARTSWTPELTALVESMVQDGALFGDIAKEVSKVVGRDVDPATIYNRVVRTASERKTVGKPIEPSSAWPADALNILRSDEIKDLSYSKISSLLEDRTGNIYSRNAVASKLAAIRREKGDPLFAIRDERSADARFELERPQAVRGDLGTGSGRSSGQQPAQGAAIAGDSSGAGRVGNNAGPREFRIPGYNGRVVELENSAGQRTRNYFVYPLNAEVTTKLSGASALKYMQQVHNWTARMTLTEMAPGAWEVKGVKVRANQRRSGVGSYVYDMIERDLEAPIRPSGMLTDDGHGFWSNRDPEAVKNHRQVGDMWLSPKQLMNMKVLISQIAETETDPAQIMRLMRQNQQINDGIKSLPKEVFEPKAINAMFAFAGERAKTADLEALNRAKEMTVAGLDRAKIWYDTGWFQGVDGKWRFEIDDSGSFTDFSSARAEGLASEPLFAMVDRNVGQEMRRDLDQLGYFSGALEAAKRLKQAKGTPEQMLAMLQKDGAKKAEIEATGLAKAFEGKASVTRDEIVKHLEQNRLGLNEKTYHSSAEGSPAYEAAYNAELASAMNESRSYLRDMPDGTVRVDEIIAGPSDRGYTVMDRADAEDALRSFVSDGIGNRELQLDNPAKWQSYSLDPSNPTYRETVLHLPEDTLSGPDFRTFVREMEGKYGSEWANKLSTADRARAQPLRSQAGEAFQSGHFPEPNIVGHMMTSMTKHEGRPVYTIDQIQSDWGQKLRDGGVRDEAKIASLKRQHDVLGKEQSRLLDEAVDGFNITDPGARHTARAVLHSDILKEPAKFGEIGQRYASAFNDYVRIGAELGTAEASSHGHPLVNTTDQWTNTTLRRAIRQAAEADAEFIAIPTGDTVLSYNPGDTAGMHGFYGSASQEGIVPKNLRKLLLNIDKDSPAAIKIDKLETPTAGMKGKGFTLFPLTEKVKASVTQDGMPLFSLRAEVEAEARPLMRAAAERGVTLPDGSTVHGVPLFSIRAFHGSPHDFDRFDLSRIGNGEGQQAFGHGFYFAESPAVAKWYQEKLRRPDPQHDSLLDLIEAAREINSAKSIKEILAPVERDVEHMKKSLDDAIARRGSFGRVSWMWNREPAVPRRTTIGFYPKLIAEKEAILAMARSMTDAEIEQRLAARAGRMYEVEIDGNIDQFYHMDRPYEEQSQIIKDLIAKSRMAHLAPMDFSEIAITPKGAKALLDIGILGIRYLDGNSRDGGAGTHNYVVFDDKLVKIVKKNGRPVTAPPLPRDDALFSLRADSDPDPMIKSDMAFIDRLAQMKDLIEACRA